MSEPTPGPWNISPSLKAAICDYSGRTIASTWPKDTDDRVAIADAELIVRAVNAHDALLAAAKALQRESNWDAEAQRWRLENVSERVINQLRSAIALATKETP